jgi:biofilm PGA synthesis N-glycosyltransferase PgaC
MARVPFPGRGMTTRRSPTLSLVGLSVATAAGHALYPVALEAVCRIRGARPQPLVPPADGAWPGITVVIPAFREAGAIAGKVANVEANGYPGEVEVIVISEDAETAAAARATSATVIEPTQRLGKSQAENVAVEAAAHEIVVITDANNQLVDGALAALVPHFADPTVGCVGGAKTEEGEGEALYWRYETWLKERESWLGTTIGIVGELFAVRKSAWQPIPVGIASDDLWTALDLSERGHAVRYEPAASSVEPSAAPDEQWERRTRITAIGLTVFSRKRHLLHPRHGLLSFQIIGHKLWRTTVSPIAHLALLVVALRARRTSRLAQLVLAVHAIVGALIPVQRRGASLPGPLSAGCQVIYLQFVALAGMYRFLRGRNSPLWEKLAR